MYAPVSIFGFWCFEIVYFRLILKFRFEHDCFFPKTHLQMLNCLLFFVFVFEEFLFLFFGFFWEQSNELSRSFVAQMISVHTDSNWVLCRSINSLPYIGRSQIICRILSNRSQCISVKKVKLNWTTFAVCQSAENQTITTKMFAILFWQFQSNFNVKTNRW